MLAEFLTVAVYVPFSAFVTLTIFPDSDELLELFKLLADGCIGVGVGAADELLDDADDGGAGGAAAGGGGLATVLFFPADLSVPGPDGTSVDFSDILLDRAATAAAMFAANIFYQYLRK